MKLPFPLALAVEKAIEAVLKMDPETCQRLQALEGKTVRVNVTSPRLELLLMVVDGLIHIAQPDNDSDEADSADTTISGDLMALRSLIDGNDAVYSRQVTIEGDIGTSGQLKHIIAQLDPDWQDAVSPFLGDSVTHRLDVAQAGLRGWIDRTRGASRQNTSEYLQEEVQLLAPNSEVAHFCTQVDEVRAAADRIAARLQRLEALNASATSES